jgi:hypothetical protein
MSTAPMTQAELHVRLARRAIPGTMIDTQAQATTRLSHLRAYLAGTGATSSLIAGAMVVFLSLAAFVAFHGVPFGNSGGSFGSAYVSSNAAGAPEAAGQALAAAPRSVALTAVPGAPAGAAIGNAPSANGSAASGTAPTSPGGATAVTTSPTTSPSVTTESPQATGGGGPITGTVDQVDPTPGGDLSQTTNDATQQLDNTVNQTQSTVNQTLNNVQPGLGDSVDQTVNQVTGGLLNGGG